MSDICEAGWAFDVDFDVICVRVPGHDGEHIAIVDGNYGVTASITWTAEPNPGLRDNEAPQAAAEKEG